MVEKTNRDFQKVVDFLKDDLFLLWRVNPTPELNVYWENFIKMNPQLQDSFNQAIKELDKIRSASDVSTQIQEQVKERIMKNILLRKNRKRNIFYYSSAAAAVLLLIVSSLFFIGERNRLKNQSEEFFVLGHSIPHNQIQLISGDNVTNLSNNSSLNLSESPKSVIIQDSLSQKEIKLNEHVNNRLIIPYGKRSSLVLADGTKVWLNSGTEIQFPSVFSEESRDITVSGEIFLEVAKQKKPFRVHTFNSEIQVFGTSFNVSAYKDETKESIVLVEGSVKVVNYSRDQSLVLSPNQMAEIQNGKIKSQNVDVSEYISWKNGFIKLAKTPLDQALIKIGRYYNVEFRYSESLNINTKTCSGKLFLSDDIDDVLKAFADMTLLNYEKTEGRIIYIKHR